MKAAVYTRAGDPDVIRIENREVPPLAADQVRIRLMVSGVNPSDWQQRRGLDPSGYQVPGHDGAGFIDEVGPLVTHFRVGDRVWMWDAAWMRPDGTAQEYLNLPARNVALLPDNASYELGAYLGIPALTAHLALRAGEPASQLSAGCLEGQFVLVSGGAGAVGHAAIELGRWAGAHVITTVSNETKAVLASAAGANTVINYRTEDAAGRIMSIAPAGVDKIVEVNQQANAELNAVVSKPHSTIAIYASGESCLAPETSLQTMMKNLTHRHIVTFTAHPDEKAAAVQGVSAAITAGALHVGEKHGLPLALFDLSEAPAAHQAVEDGTIGKVLLLMPK